MKYDLDRIIDREGTGSVKWEMYRGGSNAGPITPVDACLESDGPIPMWVADMDFRSPQPIVDALVERASNGVYGYTDCPEALSTLLCERLQRVYGCTAVTPTPEWFHWLPGLLPGSAPATRRCRRPRPPPSSRRCSRARSRARPATTSAVQATTVGEASALPTPAPLRRAQAW